MPDKLLYEKKYNTREAAGLLGVSIRQVQTLADNGTIPAYRIGRKLVFTESDLEAYLIKCRQAPTSDEPLTRTKKGPVPAVATRTNHLNF